MASFGWSAGDIVATITLVSRVIQCVAGAQGAREHFQELVSELQGLSRVLHEISELTRMPGQIPEIQALKYAACSCDETLHRFYEKIRPFESSLGATSTQSKLKAAPRMVRWELLVKRSVPEFRSYIVAHVGSLNLRLSTALLKASSNSQLQLQRSNQKQGVYIGLLQGLATAQTTIFEKINKIPTEDTVPKIDSLLAIAMEVWTSQNEILSYLAKALLTLPAPDLDHTWAQAPVRFEDALGRRFIVPSEYGWDKLEAIIQAQFKNGPGCAKVRSGEYELFDRISGHPISETSFSGFIREQSCTWIGCRSSRVRKVGFETMACMECQSIFRKSIKPLSRPMKSLVSDLIFGSLAPRGAIDAAGAGRRCYKNVSIYLVELPATPAQFQEKYHRDYPPLTARHQLELDSLTQQTNIPLHKIIDKDMTFQLREEAKQTAPQIISRGLRSTLHKHISHTPLARLNFHTSAQERYSNRKSRKPKSNQPDSKSGGSTTNCLKSAERRSGTSLAWGREDISLKIPNYGKEEGENKGLFVMAPSYNFLNSKLYNNMKGGNSVTIS